MTPMKPTLLLTLAAFALASLPAADAGAAPHGTWLRATPLSPTATSPRRLARRSRAERRADREARRRARQKRKATRRTRKEARRTARRSGSNRSSTVKLACAPIRIAKTILAKNVSNSIAQRRLTFARQTGTVVGSTRRSWNTYVRYDLDRAFFELRKRGGRSAVDFIVCQHRSETDPGTPIWSGRIAKGTGNAGQVFRRELRGLQDAFVSLRIKGRSVANRFQYEVRLRRPTQGQRWKVDRRGAGPVRGWAELHSHQNAEIAHGGGYIWGNHANRQGLSSCRGDNHAARAGFRGKHPRRTKAYTYWPHYADGSHSMLGWKELRQAHRKGLRLFVATAVNNQALCYLMRRHRRPGTSCDDMRSAKQQIIGYLKFARANADWYQIARDPWEARRIIRAGKMAVVLAVEVSNLFPRALGRWEDQFDELYDMGVRSFEIAHEVDSRFAGSAAQHGIFFKILNFVKRVDRPRSFGGWLNTFERSRRPKFCQAPRANWSCNKYGLKSEKGEGRIGERLVRKMMEHHFLIPLDHMSRRARRDVFRLAQANRYYPLYATHSRMDRVLHPWDRRHGGTEEYMLTDENLLMIRRTGGVFGLRTGTEVMREIPGCLNKPLTCYGSAESLAQNVCWGAKYGLAIAMGTDMNTGPAEMTAPRFGHASKYTQRHDGLPAACPKNVGMGWVTPKGYRPTHRDKAPKRVGGPHMAYRPRGLAHIGFARDLVEDMQKLGAPVGETGLLRSAETFLRMWERTYARRATQPLSAAQYAGLMGTQVKRYADPKPGRRYSKALLGVFKKAMKKFPGDVAKADAWFRRKAKAAWGKTDRKNRGD